MRRIVGCGILVLLWSIGCVAFQAQSQPDLYASQAIPTLVSKIIPGAQVIPGTPPTIHMPDGSTKQLSTPGLTGRPVPTGWLFVTGIEIADDHAAAMQALARLQQPTNTPSYIAAFYVDSTGILQSFQSGVLESAAPLTQVGYIYFPIAPQDGSFPIIRVLAWHWYEGTDWVGTVRFTTRLDTSTMTILERVPTVIGKQTKSGFSNGDYVTSSRVDSANILIQGSLSTFSVSYPCGTPCIVNGTVLLGNL
jgi:hypothetical protein